MSKCQRHFVNVMHKETSKKQNQAHLHQLKMFPNGTSTRKIKRVFQDLISSSADVTALFRHTNAGYKLARFH